MSARQVAWAHRARAALIEQLGGACWACGALHSLEIDHIHGRNWTPSKKGLTWRISIYRREAREGLIRLLCQPCNGSNKFLHVDLPKPVTALACSADSSDPY